MSRRDPVVCLAAVDLTPGRGSIRVDEVSRCEHDRQTFGGRLLPCADLQCPEGVTGSGYYVAVVPREIGFVGGYDELSPIDFGVPTVMFRREMLRIGGSSRVYSMWVPNR